MKTLRDAVLGCAILLCPAVAQAQGGREMVAMQLSNAVPMYESRGFHLDTDAVSRDVVIGLLPQDGLAYLELRLEPEVDYLIEAFCDEDCDDLDLLLLSSEGETVASDVEPDDVPELLFRLEGAGSYYLGVKVVTCEAALCFFGYRVLRK